MTLYLAAVGGSRAGQKDSPAALLATEFLTRTSRYLPTEAVHLATVRALLAWLERRSGRTDPYLILLDSRGRQLSSEEFAAHLGTVRDGGTQTVIVAVGPPNGWSTEARAKASLLLSLGPMTLPHELARAVAAEQVYRAMTILAGHPYHCGH